MDDVNRFEQFVLPKFCITAGIIGTYLIATGAFALVSNTSSSCNLNFNCERIDLSQIQIIPSQLIRMLSDEFTPVNSLPVWCITFGLLLIISAVILFKYNTVNYHPYFAMAIAFVSLTSFAIVGAKLITLLSAEKNNDCRENSPYLYWSALISLIVSILPITLVGAVTIYLIFTRYPVQW